jgi:casein kinase II subunit alpha
MILGHKGFREYFEKYGGTLTKAQASVIYHQRKPNPKLSWWEFVDHDNHETASDLATDLLDKMMVYDHALRITPKDAMKHAYFDSVRE